MWSVVYQRRGRAFPECKEETGLMLEWGFVVEREGIQSRSTGQRGRIPPRQYKENNQTRNRATVQHSEGLNMSHWSPATLVSIELEDKRYYAQNSHCLERCSQLTSWVLANIMHIASSAIVIGFLCGVLEHFIVNNMILFNIVIWL